MSMNLPAAGGEGDQVIAAINTTPLVDVMLVLLTMLIITIPVQLHSINLNMATGTPPKSELKPEVLRLDIDGRSVISWNGETLADRAEVERRTTVLATMPQQRAVPLRPDRPARYDVVAAEMASAQRLGLGLGLGLTKIGIVGTEQSMQ